MQLRSRLASDLGLTTRLPATIVFDHPTCRALGAFLAGQVDGGRPPATPETPPAVPEGKRSDIDGLSEEQAEALLLERLDSIEGNR
jgi:hypothetical protein